MTNRPMQADYERLGDYIRAGRRRAGYSTREAFADRINISSRTLADIENGVLGKRKEFSRETMAAIEDAIDWFPGATRRVLESPEADIDSLFEAPRAAPEPEYSQWQDASAAKSPSLTAARMRTLEGAVLDLTRRIEAIEQRQLEKGVAGAATTNQADAHGT